MAASRTWELRLADGRRVLWDGATGEAAARAYVAVHRTAAVVAWRDYPRTGLFIGMDPRRIIG